MRDTAHHCESDASMLRFLVLSGLCTIGLLAGCHHSDQVDRREVIIHDDAHRFEHRGYYDADHCWHGGYYDERHDFHTDPHNFHGIEHDVRGPHDTPYPHESGRDLRPDFSL